MSNTRREAAYEAVRAVIDRYPPHGDGSYAARENARLWRAVDAALNAVPPPPPVADLAELAAAKPEGWESVAALQEAYATTDGWLEDARQECKQLRADLAQAREALQAATMLACSYECIEMYGLGPGHTKACKQRRAALAAPSTVEAPAPDQTRDEASEVAP